MPKLSVKLPQNLLSNISEMTHICIQFVHYASDRLDGRSVLLCFCLGTHKVEIAIRPYYMYIIVA